MARMPEEQQQEFQRVDVRDYLQVLWRGKFIIVITTVLVVAGAFFYSYLQENEYQSYAEMIVTPRDISEIVPGLGGSFSVGGSGDGRSNPLATELIFMGAEDMRDARAARSSAAGPRSRSSIRPKGRRSSASSPSARTRASVAEDANVYVEEYIADRREKTQQSLESNLNGLTAKKGPARRVSWRRSPAIPRATATRRSRRRSLQTDTDIANAQRRAPCVRRPERQSSRRRHSSSAQARSRPRPSRPSR